MDTSRAPDGCARAFASLFVGFALLLCCYGLFCAWRDHATKSWPVTTAQITRSMVEHERDQDGETFRPKVDYSYRVGGQMFVGKRVSYGVDSLNVSQGVAAAYVLRYPVGASVPVAYHPRRFGDSVLEPGATRHSFSLAAGASAFACVGACMHLALRRSTNAPGASVFTWVLYVAAFLAAGGFWAWSVASV